MSEETQRLLKLAEEYELHRKARLKKKQTDRMLEHIYEVLMGAVTEGKDDDF